MICILSGGLDSTVLAHHLRAAGEDVDLLSFHYGQRHAREIDAATRCANRLGLRHDIIDLRALGALLAVGGSSLISHDVAVPEGHYADDSMKATVVPNRNMIMLSIAGGVAIARKHGAVAYAAHAGDHAIYPDCRAVFAGAIDVALRLADWSEVALVRPFVALTKANIVERGAALNVPMGDTWSCYKGGDEHCGKCGTCVERREAFAIAGVVDSTDYKA